jgi:hypothetical protein
MSMTLWLHVLHDRKIESDETDYSSLWRFTEALDGLCASLGIPLFSSFIDRTDVKYNLVGKPEDAELDPETGWAYGIDDMRWFDVKDGLRTLRALESHLAGEPEALGLKPGQLEALLEELREVCTKLESADSDARFHLELVM